MFQRFITWVMHHGELYILLLIVFSETELFIEFFLPGDCLLFASGIYINDLSSNFYHVHIAIIILMVVISSFTGSIVDYWFGYKTGPQILGWTDPFLFKKKYLFEAERFYHNYGYKSLFFSKFMPRIRTYCPIIAGIMKVSKRKFVLFNLAGSLSWVTTIMLGGHFLQSFFLKRYQVSLKDHMIIIAIVIILITALPSMYRMVFGKKFFYQNKYKSDL